MRGASWLTKGEQPRESALIVDLPVRVLVRGADAATRVFSALDRASVALPPDPAAHGQAWWSLRAACGIPVSEAIRDAVLRADDALMVSTADGERFDVVLVDDDTSSDLYDAEPADVVAWTARHRPTLRPPKPISNPSRERPDPDPLDDPAARWLVAAGWPLHQGFLDSRLLKDFKFAQTLGDFPSYGETRISWHATRWCGGFTRSRDSALWDRDTPRSPVRRWPDDTQETGRKAVIAELRRLIVDPIIDATTLPGRRWWTTLRPTRKAFPTDDSAVLAHWNPEGHMSVIIASDAPSTVLLSRRDYANLKLDAAAAFGSGVGTLSDIDVPLASEDVVLSVARASLPLHELGEWERVPDTVPRSLVECTEWVREQR
jgi:hypothetical protein